MARREQTNAMQRSAFLSLLRQKKLSGSWLLEGEEDNLRDEALRAIRSSLLTQGMEELDSAALDAPDTDALIAACETLPFMSGMRLVIVHSQPGFSGKMEADERLCEYLPHVPATCLLLFPFHGAADRRKILTKAFDKLSHIVRFDRMDDAELQAWIIDRFAAAGVTCDPNAAREMVFIGGSDSTVLLNETDKVISLAQDGFASVELIREAVTPTTEYNVFRMVDASVEGRKAEALRMLHDARINGADDLYLLSLFLRQYRMLQHVKIMQHEKIPPSSYAKQLSVQDFVAERLIRQASRMSNRQVKQSLNLCVETEYRVKNGELQARDIMETVMLKLFQPA